MSSKKKSTKGAKSSQGEKKSAACSLLCKPAAKVAALPKAKKAAAKPSLLGRLKSLVRTLLGL